MKKIIFIVVILLMMVISVFINFNKLENEIIDDSVIKNETKMRGIGDTYTDPISINGNAIYNISSKSWSVKDESLPLLFQLISPKNKIEITLLSRKKNSPFFSIPANTLCDKHGYLLKISDQLHHIMVKSRIIVSCKQDNNSGGGLVL